MTNTNPSPGDRAREAVRRIDAALEAIDAWVASEHHAAGAASDNPDFLKLLDDDRVAAALIARHQARPGLLKAREVIREAGRADPPTECQGGDTP